MYRIMMNEFHGGREIPVKLRSIQRAISMAADICRPSECACGGPTIERRRESAPGVYEWIRLGPDEVAAERRRRPRVG